MAKGKSVKKKAAKKQAPKNPRQQFNAHCQAIKQQHLRMDSLHRQQTELLTRFQQQLLPLEKQYIDTVYQKAERLLSFTDKGSLSAKHHDTLLRWITEEIIYLEDYPFTEHLDLEGLKEKHRKACSEMMVDELNKNDLRILRTLLGEELPFVYQISDEELHELVRDTEKFNARVKQELTKDDKDPLIEQIEQKAFAAREQRQQQLTALFNASAADRMHKQLVSALHPDQEVDEAVKQDRHHLMQQLTQARQDHDIWTIINLYQQHIDPDGGLKDQDLPKINQLLAEQLVTLNFNYRQRQQECDPIIAVLWDKFGDAKTPQALDKKLIRYANEINVLLEEESEELAELSSTKTLALYLEKREREIQKNKQFMF